jgi:hypothetical protein
VVLITRVLGGVLLALGVIAYLATGMASATALAPAAPGALLLILGLLAGREDRRPTMIHVALGVALLAVLASGMPLMELPDLLAGEEVERPAAVVTSALMALLSLAYLVVGVRSFIAARRARETGRA